MNRLILAGGVLLTTANAVFAFNGGVDVPASPDFTLGILAFILAAVAVKILRNRR